MFIIIMFIMFIRDEECHIDMHIRSQIYNNRFELEMLFFAVLIPEVLHQLIIL